MSEPGGSRSPVGGPGAVATTVTLRPIATPLPISLLALAVGSFILAGSQLHWVPQAQGHPIAICLLCFVAPLQLTGFIFGVLSRDESAAAGIAVLSGTWVSIGVVTLVQPIGSRSAGLGLLLVAAATALAVPAAISVSSKPLMTGVLLLTAARFALTGVYELGAGSAWRTATAVVGLVVSAVAVYAAAAFGLENAQRRAVLPIGRRNLRSSASPRSTPDPVGPVAYDAGVRSEL